MQIVRRIASELRPSVLDQLGLEAAIDTLVRETTQRTGIAVCFHADDFPRLPDEIASHAYRIIQEALTNVSRHSKATRSEEHTSELQSQSNLVCRLLLEKKKKTIHTKNDADVERIEYKS